MRMMSRHDLAKQKWIEENLVYFVGGGVDVGPIPPPVTSNWLLYFEAGQGTTLSSAAAANYGKIDAWTPAYGSGNLAQATDANRMRWRSNGLYPVVYQWQADGSRTMANATAVIDKRDASIFCLVELGQLIVNSVAENQTLVSLPGAVGELYLNKASSSHFKVAWKDGTGTYVSSLVPASSLNLIGVTLSAGAVVVHCNGQSETLAAAALAAGTVTGFSINFGTLAYGDAWGYNFVGVTNNALDAGELAAVEAWGRQRKAIYPSDSDVLQQLFTTGASRSVGYHAEGNLDHGRRLGWDATQRLLYKVGFGGIGIGGLQTRVRTELGVNVTSNAPGTGFNNPDKIQVVILDVPTADTTAGIAAATQIAALTTIRQEIRQMGYDLIVHGMPPATDAAGWSDAKRIIANDVNVGMAALDTRLYGQYVPVPTELQDASSTTYFYDGLHYTKAGYDAIYTQDKPYVDAFFTRSPSSLKGLWTFNGTLQDSSGFKRDLVAQAAAPSYGTGLLGGQCVECLASGLVAVRSNNPGREYDFSALTVVGWFKANATGNNYWLTKAADAGGSKSWYIYRHSGGTLRAGMSDTSGEINAGATTQGAWYGVALIIDATSVRLYRTDAGGDASTFALVGTATWSAGQVVPNAGTGRGQLRVGTSDPANATDTSAQGLHVYNESLSLAEMQALSPIDGS